MDLSLLRGFASGVRVELVGVVGARLAGVLLPGSVERVEFPEAVRRLEGVIARSGRDVVVDQVAYTWFNRLVALRFMDVNGYTSVGVVSPPGGAVAGQPEVLADAKAGHVDAGVVGEKVRDRVIGLLSGSVVSRDGQGEAFKLLLAAYCNHWAGPMPFMFERSGDFTELLVPDDLLSDRSIVARIVRTLTPDVCSDVEVIGWLYQFYIAARKDEVFAGFKKNKKATALEIPAATQLFTPHWIVKYLVENSLGRLWLLNNPGSDLVSRMEYYIAPVEPEADFLRISGPEELKVLDPACGSGHMLTYAFDLLFLMYEEAGYAPSDIPGLILKHNLFGAEIDPRAGALAAFALSMKARARQKSFLNPGKGTEPNICVLQPVRFTADELEPLVTRGGDKHAEVAFWQAFEDADTFGSLIRPNQDLIAPLMAHVESLGDAETLFGGDVLDRARTVLVQSQYLSTRYHVVVANPPYMGAKNLGAKLDDFLKTSFPMTRNDLFAAFVERGIEGVMAGGYCGIMSPNVWLYLPAHRNLRDILLTSASVKCLVELPLSGFAGATVQICAFTFQCHSSENSVTNFIRLTEDRGGEAGMAAAAKAVIGDPADARSIVVDSANFRRLPKEIFAYWLDEEMITAFTTNPSLIEHADPRKGMVTADNDRFIRCWWEVSANRTGRGMPNRQAAKASQKKWFPYLKGGKFRRWYGNVESVVNWEHDGAELFNMKGNGYKVGSTNHNLDYIFRPAISWTKITSSANSFRANECGYLFDDASGLCYVENEISFAGVLGFLNSMVASDLLAALNPTMNLQPGNLASLPLAGIDGYPGYSQECVDISRRDWNSAELSMDFERSILLLTRSHSQKVVHSIEAVLEDGRKETRRMLDLERLNSAYFLKAFGLDPSGVNQVEERSVSLELNPAYRYEGSLSTDQAQRALRQDVIRDFCSYAVGCMFGRYSLDSPGLVLADQADSLAEYLAKVPTPSFLPDEDNVLPVLSDSWFEDDIVERFRSFLKVSFGEEHFEENLRFIEAALGRDVRKYFVQDFYKDHVQRYKKRPIYWMFSSPKGSFNALIYMHRYRPDTVSVVLNDYLHEFQAKLRARRANVDLVIVSMVSTAKEQTAARKESEQIGKMLLELEEWEQSVLYPLATEQIAIDLDDGVKANYPKFGAALKKIVGLEANE